MRIEKVNIFSADGVFRKGAVEFDDVIQKIEFDAGQDDDAGAYADADAGAYADADTDAGAGHDAGAELYLIPGLIDIHTHGAVNGDHSDGSEEYMQDMAMFYAKNGVTSFLATTITCSGKQLEGAMQNISRYKRQKNGARCAGVNMEGPFLSYEKRGAHTDEFLQPPSIPMFEKMHVASGGSIRLVSIAPELPGAMEFIKAASQVCKVALAHSAAGYDTAIEAFKSGASHVTHLFNAMSPFSHRDPAIPGAAMDSRAYVEIISDGVHLHPSVIRAVFSMFPERVCLVSDSIRSTGLPEGNYELGGLPVIVKNGKVTLEDGTIAGSNARLIECVRNAVSYGVPIEKAIAAATINNARAAGLGENYGSLEPGACADMVLLDKNLDIQKVYIAGSPVE